jgi:hypothetical protein
MQSAMKGPWFDRDAEKSMKFRQGFGKTMVTAIRIPKPFVSMREFVDSETERCIPNQFE